jgi:hypothetical protein
MSMHDRSSSASVTHRLLHKRFVQPHTIDHHVVLVLLKSSLFLRIQMIDNVVWRCWNAVRIQHLIDLGAVQNHLLFPSTCSQCHIALTPPSQCCLLLRDYESWSTAQLWRSGISLPQSAHIKALKDAPEWYAMSTLHGGQFSTGSSRITRSLNTMIFNCLNMARKCRMLRIVSDLI